MELKETEKESTSKQKDSYQSQTQTKRPFKNQTDGPQYNGKSNSQTSMGIFTNTMKNCNVNQQSQTL